MATRLAITLDDDQQRQLEALAAQGNLSASEVASHAIAEYLAEDAAFRRAVAEGLAAIDAGDVVDYRPYMENLRRRMALREAERGE